VQRTAFAVRVWALKIRVKERFFDALVAASVPFIGTIVLLLMAKQLTPHDFAIYSSVATAQIFITVLGGPVLFSLIDISLLRSAAVEALVCTTVFVIRLTAGVVCILAVLSVVLEPVAVTLSAVSLFASGVARTLAEYLCTHAGVSGRRRHELVLRALPGALMLLSMLGAYHFGTQLHVALLCVALSQGVAAIVTSTRLAPGANRPSLADVRLAYRAYASKMGGLRLNLISVFIFAAPLIIYTWQNKGQADGAFVAFAMQMLNSGVAFYSLLVSAQLRKTALWMMEKPTVPLPLTRLLKPLVTCLPVALMMACGVLAYVRIKAIPVPAMVFLPVIFGFFSIELFQSYWTGVTFRGNFRNLEICAFWSALTNVIAAFVISNSVTFLSTLAAAQMTYFLLPHLFSYGTRKGISRHY
jgi:hypothetical protein